MTAFETLRTKISNLQKRIMSGTGTDTEIRELVELEIEATELAEKEAANQAAMCEKQAKIEAVIAEKKRLQALSDTQTRLVKLESKAAALARKQEELMQAVGLWVAEVMELHQEANAIVREANVYVKVVSETSRQSTITSKAYTIKDTTLEIPTGTELAGGIIEALRRNNLGVNVNLYQSIGQKWSRY